MSVNPELFSNLLSLGLAFVNSNVVDASGLSDRLPSYEIFTQSYVRLPAERLFIRPALRFAYEPKADLESAKSAAIKEETLKSHAEVGLLYDGLVVPVVALHGAYLRRKLTLTSSSPLDTGAGNDLTRAEYFWQGGITFGLGLPALNGDLIIEPFYRLVRIVDDKRHRSQWGIDLSYALHMGAKAQQSTP